jgi:peptidoglycan/LPS O-acetylase OafA/YrhL
MSDARVSSEERTALAPPAAPRLEYIDGLRALAALWVAVHHVIETSIPRKALSSPVLGPLLGSLFFGQFPVMVFLMLSGFCLYYPYVRKNPTSPEFNTGFVPYIRRRWRRIAPPYLWAGAFCLVMAAIPALQVGRWRQVGPIDTGVILSHVLLIHNLIPRYATKIDYPMWSIGLEWQLYLLFPTMIWAFRKAGAPLTLAATLFVAAVIRGTYRHLPALPGAVLHDGPFSYLEIFAAGMLAAALTVQRRTLLPNWLLGCIAAAGLIVVRLGSGNGLLHDLATSVAFFCVLQLAAEPSSKVSRVLSTPWLVRIGFFSYSIYLVHAPLVHLSSLALSPLRLSDDSNFAVLVFVFMPLIVLLSYGFHCLFERPFMRAPQVARPSRAGVGPVDGPDAEHTRSR